MDKALVFGTEDCRLESCQDQGYTVSLFSALPGTEGLLLLIFILLCEPQGLCPHSWGLGTRPRTEEKADQHAPLTALRSEEQLILLPVGPVA